MGVLGLRFWLILGNDRFFFFFFCCYSEQSEVLTKRGMSYVRSFSGTLDGSSSPLCMLKCASDLSEVFFKQDYFKVIVQTVSYFI